MGHNPATEISFEAVLIRADGSRQDLGTIAYWNKNPLVRWKHAFLRFVTTGRRGRITQG
jgi:hypothetical protein